MKKTTDKIILVGFMGAGKSSVLSPLANKLDLKSIEMDSILLQNSGRSSIEEIFLNDGELRFRELEIETARILKNESGCVIATGGGVIQNKIILDYLRTNGIVVYLNTSFAEIQKRLSNIGDRPLFRDNVQAEKLYNLRAPLYESYCDIVVTTDGKNIEQISEEINQKLN